VTIPDSEVISLSSKETGRDYELLVGLPPSFTSHPTRTYPVLYLLDGQWDFALLQTLAGGLRYDEVAPEFLIVGITYGGNDPDYGVLRAEDYIPTRARARDGKLMGGDAGKFLSFLEDKVLPLVEKKYRGDPSQRTLSGASFGGLFTLFALFERPELFQSYLALSPAVGWDDEWIFKRERAFNDEHVALKRRVWLSVGDQEWPGFFEENQRFIAQFQKSGYQDLQLSVRIIEGERHAGNKPEAYNRAIRFVFSDWTKAHQEK
jgi:predicted alpha/beta superfamily hydrolase